MSKPSDGLTQDQIAAKEAAQARYLRWGIIGVALILAGGFAFAVWRDASDSASKTGWDQYAEIRQKYEPPDYTQWQNPRGVYTEQREKYHRILLKFLEQEASNWDDALEPQVRWRLAKSLADHILSNPDEMDFAKRAPWYDEATQQMTIIRDRFNEHPLNWARLQQDPSTPTLTVQFLRWLQKNKQWEEKHLPSAGEPDGSHTVVLRTNRGDLRIRLFESDAPKWTRAFLHRVATGFYDGTSIFSKKDIGNDAAPEQHYVRGGTPSSRDPKPYDRDDALRWAGDFQGGGVLPEPSRNRILHTRGTVVAWHERGEEYDNESEFLIVVRRSPILDYEYTPIGRVTDESSLATLDRIFESATWNDDPETVDGSTSKYQDVLHTFQVPATIVKALAYKDGTLVQPSSETMAEHRVPPTDNEGTLNGLMVDTYKADVPPRPQVEDENAEGAEGEEKDDDATDGLEADDEDK